MREEAEQEREPVPVAELYCPAPTGLAAAHPAEQPEAWVVLTPRRPLQALSGLLATEPPRRPPLRVQRVRSAQSLARRRPLQAPKAELMAFRAAPGTSCQQLPATPTASAWS